jgi:hypothetical protein
VIVVVTDIIRIRWPVSASLYIYITIFGRVFSEVLLSAVYKDILIETEFRTHSHVFLFMILFYRRFVRIVSVNFCK